MRGIVWECWRPLENSAGEGRWFRGKVGAIVEVSGKKCKITEKKNVQASRYVCGCWRLHHLKVLVKV